MSSLLEPVLSTMLVELPVLVLDCQATSSHPAKGHLLEVAWSIVTASQTGPVAVTSRLVRMPEGVSIPAQVRRLTGFTDEELALGATPEEIYAELSEAARAVRAVSERGLGLTVVHFSSFEERYLRALRYRCCPEAPFPFHFFCTHRLAKRLLPDLPRFSLRAVAGYFGESLSELRRASDHAAATAAVWKGCLSLLEESQGIRTFEELAGWLAATRPSARMPRRRAYPMPPETWRQLPRKPGIYRMLRANGELLYIGKATSLRDRVSSYFRQNAAHADHTLEMLAQARDLEIAVTGSAVEAALLEAEEIHRRSPPYNKALRLRDRKLVFADRRLRSFSEVGHGEHRVGPLPQSSLLPTFAAVAEALEEATRAPAEELLRCERETFAQALELFRARLGGSSLLAFGAREWLRRQAQMLEEEDETEFHLELQRPAAGGGRTSPEDVVEFLVEIVVRVSHLVRRSCWHRLLSRSILVWRGRENERRVLDIEKTSSSSDALLDRGKAIDVAVYDRLTVLTREIRRLVSENRDVELQLASSHRLEAAGLARVLRWI